MSHFPLILCGVISRGTTILAKYIQVAGSNIDIDKVLEKISATSDESNTYTCEELMIYYIRQRGITYLAIAEQDFPQENVFKFLGEVMEEFQRHAGDSARSALANAYDEEFGEILKNRMLRASPSHLDNLKKDMDEVKRIMIQNIEACLERGDKIDDLLLKTDDLQTNSRTFKKVAVECHSHMWWENKKMTAIAIGGAILLVYIIVSSACGGPAWPNCV